MLQRLGPGVRRLPLALGKGGASKGPQQDMATSTLESPPTVLSSPRSVNAGCPNCVAWGLHIWNPHSPCLVLQACLASRAIPVAGDVH